MNVKTFITALGVAACFASPMAQVEAHVLDGAAEYNGHYYKIFDAPMHWKDAETFCRSMGGHLATAETADENTMLKQMVIKHGGDSHFWIGGHREKNKIWRWVTGKVIADYFDWVGNKPRSGTSGGGDNLSLYRTEDGKWDNLGSLSDYPFVCEWESAQDAHESTL